MAWRACARAVAKGGRMRSMRRELGQEANVQTCGAAIGACARAQRWEQALAMLLQMPRSKVLPNIVCYNAALSACARSLRWRHALQLFSDAAPNVVTYASAIAACVHSWEAALHLLQELNSRCGANAIAYTSAIKAVERGRCWPWALALLAEMPGRAIQADTIVLNACITACQKAEAWAQAIDLFNHIKSFGVQPDVISFNAVLAAVARQGAWPAALEALRQLRSDSLQPSTVTWNSCISACEKVLNWQRSLWLLQELRDQGQPSVISFNTALAACRSSWQAAFWLLQEMPKCALQPDLGSFHAVLTACTSGGVWQAALQLLQRVQALDLSPDKELLERAIAPILNADRLEEALVVYREGLARGLLQARRGPAMLDLHDFSLEAAQVAICEELLQLQQGDLVIITGRGSHSREGGLPMQPPLWEWLVQLGLSVCQEPQNPGRLRVAEPAAALSVQKVPRA
ncbi:unnamed protein product [Effrenium voratum]|uniref:Smr domain-containing protein n=1 Tax=Effrenium voratum TaxID=2562239 RepID=A0AA36HLC6_9DINO|nr:unnamed protein product [Effrenium voratum]CAJ1420184.1 unnamed protein product [Effrenium voratum]